MVLDRRKKGRVTQLFGQKGYLEAAPGNTATIELQPEWPSVNIPSVAGFRPEAPAAAPLSAPGQNNA